MEKILLSASLAAILAVCAACTVKEDRDFCPCSLTVSFSDPDASGPVELLAWDSETIFRDQVLMARASLLPPQMIGLALRLGPDFDRVTAPEEAAETVLRLRKAKEAAV